MATFMKQRRSSVIASHKRRCAGLRISQWHKLRWSRAVASWCGVTWAGTTSELSPARLLSGPSPYPFIQPAPA